MNVPKVFVASSSEGLDVAKPVHKLLQQALSGTADVRTWPKEFQLTKAYIESLEHQLDTFDFAVLVLTPDDCTTSRKAESLSPRDNVVFELGLFFGRLGRERCFLIQPRDLDLKLPSDLLGIESAKFSMFPKKDLKTELGSACDRIGKAVRDAMTTLPSRPRLGDAERAAQTAKRKFGDRITGTWWERIHERGEEEASALSFFRIEPDDVHTSLRLDGKAYDTDGRHVATWRSAAARLEDERIVYVRECRRRDAKTAEWLPGLGEFNFFIDTSNVIKEGEGKFWESHESRPEETVIKLVDLHRNIDEGKAFTMREGSDGEKQVLVRDTLKTW